LLRQNTELGYTVVFGHAFFLYWRWGCATFAWQFGKTGPRPTRYAISGTGMAAEGQKPGDAPSLGLLEYLRYPVFPSMNRGNPDPEILVVLPRVPHVEHHVVHLGYRRIVTVGNPLGQI